MTAPTWTSLPANAETDKALRVAAAGVCGFLEDQYSFYNPANAGRTIGKGAWLRRWNRDHLARVFAAALGRLVYFSDGTGGFNVMSGNLDPIWITARSDPRAALAALLDLLSVPVPQELQR